MPKLNISRSIAIEAPVSKIYGVLNDFNNWRPWSPWLIMEPEAKVTVEEDAKSYAWEGNRTGAGNMKILEEKENEYINYELNFLKPWKSTASTSFKFHEEGNVTKVTWTMNSSLPIFLFWMKKMTEAFVGGDFERGLDMLKAYCETDEIPSKLDFKGFSQFGGCKWIGVKTHCKIDDTAIEMPKDFGKIWEWAEANKDNVAGPGFSIYHKWDVVKGMVEYTAAIQVNVISSDLPEGFISGSIPASKAYVLRHIGRYQHLGNAWSTLYSMHRNKEFKPIKGIHPFEIYLNNPADTPEKELITDIHFAVK